MQKGFRDLAQAVENQLEKQAANDVELGGLYERMDTLGRIK